MSERLIKEYEYPWEMMPFIYTILNLVRGDLKDAVQRIAEGQFVINEYSKVNNLNMYDGIELRGASRQCG